MTKSVIKLNNLETKVDDVDLVMILYKGLWCFSACCFMLSNLWEISYQQKLPTTSSAGFTCWTEPDPIWETGSLGAQKVEIYEKSFAKWNELGWPATFQHWGSEGFGEMKFFAEWNRGYFNIQSYFCSQKLENEDFKMSMHCILYMFGWFAAANCAPKNLQGSTLNPVWNVPDISKNDFVETVVSRRLVGVGEVCNLQVRQSDRCSKKVTCKHQQHDSMPFFWRENKHPTKKMRFKCHRSDVSNKKLRSQINAYFIWFLLYIQYWLVNRNSQNSFAIISVTRSTKSV